MILYPAIDLKEGRCVRLVQGDMAQATIFNDAPAAQARHFADAGCQWLHIVDLDGAFAGRPRNQASVTAILAAVSVPVQLGGGIRDRATIEAWLAAGVRRVILGTAALSDPALVREAAAIYPGRVAVGIDARGGNVAIEGWAKSSDVTALELAARVEEAGVAAIVFTDIERDGVQKGANIEAAAEMARRVKIPVIASGGVGTLADIAALKARGVAGAILGRALYDGRLGLSAALAEAA